MEKKDLRRRATDLAWAGGITIIITLIAIAPGAIPKGSVVALVVFGGLFFSFGVIGYGLMGVPRDFQGWLATLGIGVLIWGGLAGLGRAIWPHPLPQSQLELYYLNGKLDGQTVTLANGGVSASATQPRMFIDYPNFPSTFVLSGISIVNEGAVSVEVQWVYLTFPTKITFPMGATGPWRSNFEGTEFSYFLNRTPVSPGQPPIEVPYFYGTPAPPEETKVTVRIFYGNTSQATFTIRAAN